jgi:type I restriction enzyme R subunit
MPDGKNGFVDYVLWGDDGLPLAVIEAKRTTKDATVGMQQAKLYADCLEAALGRRPLIYGTNGYQHWLWDDLMYPSRSVQGFHTKDELELLIQRRTTRSHLADVPINTTIVERNYQERAIRRIAHHFEVDNRRKALLVMATGTGKTRTAIALSDLLLRANWAKRILFLADRRSLVKQATREFAKFLPEVAPVNLLTDRHAEGRIYMSTHATMLNLINEGMGKEHRFGVGHFDLVIIDEAHRSVFRKYKAIFDHFDSLLVGLTATPREEIDRNTYDLFDLQQGVPTDAYPLGEAVADGYLVPPRAVVLSTRFLDRGIRYDDLSPEEREQWDLQELDDEATDGSIESGAMNRWLFNADTVDKVIENLMTKGIHVAGGDRLGKTIIFATNQRHAAFIAERFDVQYPHLKGTFARIITYQVEQADSLIDEFSITGGDPQIAISVDMLDTGIDVPEVVNLVFFKPVRSKIKFWQMLGRGTRLSKDLFGPGDDKTEFLVFDHCGNFEFFNQDPVTTAESTSEALGTRLFKQRLDLVAALQGEGTNPTLRGELADLLWEGVAAINLDNVVVRPHQQVTERFQSKDAWEHLSLEDLQALASEVADLPTPLPADHEQAKRFDLLLVRLQLDLLRQDPALPARRDQVKVIASALEELAAIPTVKAQLPLIEDLQTEVWWEDVTLDLLEDVRRKLRMLVTLLAKTQRGALYTSFDDDLGEARDVAVLGVVPGVGFEQFRKKARAFLRAHTNQLVIEKIHRNRPITATDLEELEAILIAEGVATDADLARGTAEAGTLGLFIRSLVGLDRASAKELFNDFFDDGTATATQIEFVNLIIDDLTEHGIVNPTRIYEPPYKDLAPTGPEGIFPEPDVERIVSTLADVRRTAESTDVA